MTQATRRKAWSVVLAGTGINLALGILYTWSIFKAEIAGNVAFGWDKDVLNDPYAICCVVFAFSMILAGRVQDRFGPRVTAFVGGLLVALGFVWISQSTSYWVWNLGFGLLTGMGIGFGYSAATPPGLKWFPAWKTGMVAGIVVSGFGLASVYIAPLATWMLGAWGLQSTMLFFGIAFAVVLSLLSLLLVNPPKGHDPAKLFPRDDDGEAAPAAVVASGGDVAPSRMLRRPGFWVLWTAYAVGAGAGLMVISSVAGMAKSSLGELAFVAVALLAVGNAAGRIIAGTLSDRIGRTRTLRLMLIFQAVLMFVAIPIVGAEAPGVLILVAIATLIGFNYGTNLALFPSLCKDRYGLKNFGMNYGLMFTAWGVGGFILSRVSQMLVESAGNVAGKYTWSFVTAGVLLVGAAALTLLLGERPAGAAEDEEEPDQVLGAEATVAAPLGRTPHVGG
ncbi:MAG: OFA family MFS transporter [Planctomycetota bacterium]|nr:OFA family MFS transporter [Planctomycetota bacterium]